MYSNFYLYFSVGILLGTSSFTIELRICEIAAKNLKYKSIIKKNKKKLEKIALIAKSKLNGKEFLISKALIDLNISHDEFILVNNLLKKYYDMKEEIKSLKTYNTMSSYCLR